MSNPYSEPPSTGDRSRGAPAAPSGSPPQFENPSGPPPRDWLRLATRGVFVLLLAMLLLPLVLVEAPREIARWYAASAWNQYYDDDLEGAIRTMGTAIDWDETEPGFYLGRAMWRKDLRRFDGALEDANRVIELNPVDDRGYSIRSEIHYLQQRPQQVVDDWKQFLKVCEDAGARPGESALNGMAYYFALADRELKQGLEDVEQSIELQGGDFSAEVWGGLLLARFDRPHAALRLLDRALEKIDAQIAVEQQRLKEAQQARAYLGDLLDVNAFEKQRQDLSNSAARVYYYRSLAHEAAGETQQQQRDLERIRELGSKPENFARPLENVDLRATGLVFRNLAQCIDTRGFLHYRLGNFDKALQDLDTAVELTEAVTAYIRSLPADKQPEVIVDANEFRSRRRDEDHSIAVIRYHRALVHQALGQEERAERDLDYVRKLGFEPGRELY